MARGGLTAVLVLLLTPRASETSNPNFKILSYYDTVFEDQKSLLTLAIAENAEANQFFRAGVPSLAPLDNIASAIYKRGHTATGGSVLLPGWETRLEAWHQHLKPSLDNGTIAGIFIGDEICCHLSVSCWDSLLNPLAEKLRALLGPDKILYTNECGDAIAGRNCSCDPRSSPTCGGCDAGHPGQPPITHISPALSHISVDLYAGYGPDSAHFNGSAEVAALRPFVEREIYPRMGPGQLFIAVPGTFACSDLHWAGLAESDRQVATKMEEYFAWAKADPRIAGLNPWHWDFRHSPQAGGHCDMRLGAVNLTKTRGVLRKISSFIKAAAGRRRGDN
jgi:hypothetical protein